MGTEYVDALDFQTSPRASQRTVAGLVGQSMEDPGLRTFPKCLVLTALFCSPRLGASPTPTSLPPSRHTVFIFPKPTLSSVVP